MIHLECESCGGRWSALPLGSTMKRERVSYHFSRDSLRCPRCGDEGISCWETQMHHASHSNVVASRVNEALEAFGVKRIGFDQATPPSGHMQTFRGTQLESALRTIRGPEDRGPWIGIYRKAGGGYEGLQAIAAAALEWRDD